jgi:hypothetical protein
MFLLRSQALRYDVFLMQNVEVKMGSENPAEHETFREQTLRIAAAMLENPAPVVEAVAALMEFNERQEQLLSECPRP